MVQWSRICQPMQGIWFDTRSWKVSGRLSLCTLTTEPLFLEPMLHSKRSHHNEKIVHYNENPVQPQKKKRRKRYLQLRHTKYTSANSLKSFCGLVFNIISTNIQSIFRSCDRDRAASKANLVGGSFL